MHVFTADGFAGELGRCDEGELEWIEKDRLPSLAQWEGDRLFHRLIDENAPFFSLKLRYEGERLAFAALNAESLSYKTTFTYERKTAMKSIRTVKIGSLREKDPEKRGRIEVWDVPEDPLGGGRKDKGRVLRHLRLGSASYRGHLRLARALRNGPRGFGRNRRGGREGY
jgi:hypothetical protein